MTKPHKHADVIKAWADGAKIQFYNCGCWCDVDTKNPCWYDTVEYRIKPKEKIVRWQWIYKTSHKQLFGVTDFFYTTKEEAQMAIDSSYGPVIIDKAEWTRWEFDE